MPPNRARTHIISTHVPSAGTTWIGLNQKSLFIQFQPTSPPRGRPQASARLQRYITISTHVPSAGTTRKKNLRMYWRWEWISTHVPSAGTTGKRTGCQKMVGNFNPRPLRGDDQKSLFVHIRLNNFNPRPLRGDDLLQSQYVIVADLFQPTSPPRGRPITKRPVICRDKYFNPRPLRGDDHLILMQKNYCLNFNPRPLRGDDPAMRHRSDDVRRFQPTSPPRGRPKNGWGNSLLTMRFQPTSPPRGRPLLHKPNLYP